MDSTLSPDVPSVVDVPITRWPAAAAALNVSLRLVQKRRHLAGDKRTCWFADREELYSWWRAISGIVGRPPVVEPRPVAARSTGKALDPKALARELGVSK